MSRRLRLAAGVFAALVATSTGASDVVSVQVNPHVVMAGTAFWLTCHVPRSPHNRLLEYGVVNYREGSQRQLDGERAQATWKVLIEHTPCDVGPAYCAVLTDAGRWTRASMAVLVGGCE